MKHVIQVIGFVSIIIGSISTTSGQDTAWKVDPSHSTLGFSIDHLVISETVGEFREYEMDIKADNEDFTDAVFSVSIQTASIDTENEDRDNHLRSEDFFNVAKNPVIHFAGKEFRKVSKEKYLVTGDLTINGVTKRLEFNAKFGGIVKDPWGGTRAGLKLWGEIDRYEYGLKYNSFLEAGGLSIGQIVRIECRLELIKA